VLNRLWQLIRKEFIQIFRDRSARFAIIVPPILQILIYGYAATFELHHIKVAMLDLDHSYESRDLISRFISSKHFEIVADLENRHQIATLIDRGKITVGLQILPGFSEALRKGTVAQLQIILDGADSNTALVALSYIDQISNDFAADYTADRLEQISPLLVSKMPVIEFAGRPWYNPNLDSRWFFVPGTIAGLLLTSIVTLAAFGIVREREVGTLEQIMVSPISRSELIAGKTIPAFIVGLTQGAITMIIGRLWFQVPFRGSYLLLAVGSAIFILSVLGITLLISFGSRTQQQAMVGTFFFVMPAFVLSGFSFPISGMPVFMQWLTLLDPMRYYLVVIRDLFLKGNGWDLLMPQLEAMTVLAVIPFGIAFARFRKSLD